jgi:hypothetical protein
MRLSMFHPVFKVIFSRLYFEPTARDLDDWVAKGYMIIQEYGTSLLLARAMNPAYDIIIAYEANLHWWSHDQVAQDHQSD